METTDAVRSRLLVAAVLIAWAFAHIAVSLVIVTFAIKVPYLSLFIHIVFAALLALYGARRLIIKGYAHLSDRFVVAHLAKFLSPAQMRENALAIRMLKARIRENIFPKMMIVVALGFYVSASTLFHLVHLSAGAIAVLLLVVAAITADEALLGYRIATSQYADNETEIREVLDWIVRRSDSHKGDDDPKARILPSPEHAGRVTEAEFGTARQV